MNVNTARFQSTYIFLLIFFLYFLPGRGFEAEHHQRALNGLPHVRFRIDRGAKRYGILTTEEVKYAMMTLFNNFLREQRIAFQDPLIMEKPEKHGLVHNGKARKTRSCSSWGILETTRGCSHSEPPACWRAFQKHCFSSPDFAFCHALFLTVFPAEFQV